MKQKLSIILWVVLPLITFFPKELKACTGITLKAKDGSCIVARTIEWGGSNLNSQYVVVPRGYEQQSYIPGGTTEGMIFTARYGYIGLAVEQEQFVAEGLNEAGLSAGLFYFPQYGKYEAYNPKEKASSIADLQLVSWILGSCKTVDEVKESIKKFMSSVSIRGHLPPTGVLPTPPDARSFSKSSMKNRSFTRTN